MRKITSDNLFETVGTVSGASAGLHVGKLFELILLDIGGYATWIRIPAAFVLRMTGTVIGAALGNKAGRVADKVSK